MSGVTGGLKLELADLNDFISPSQACIKPIQKSEPGPASSKLSKAAKVDIEIEYDGVQVTEVDVQSSNRTPLARADISLEDCLACSGCVTSAESVLIQMQSSDELLKVLEENKACRVDGITPRIVVISISPQSKASLAVSRNLDIDSTTSGLDIFFKSMGCDYVFDTTFSRNFALLESGREFVKRMRGASSPDGASQGLPMLCSSCPGWVCYAEKTHGDFIIPFISTTRSPQQIMGSLAKSRLAELLGKSPKEIYHVSIMPCFDKKLEASSWRFAKILRYSCLNSF